MGFNIREGISIFDPFPRMDYDKYMLPYLLTYMSWVLDTRYILDEYAREVLQVLIWEYDKVKVDSFLSTKSYSVQSSGGRGLKQCFNLILRELYQLHRVMHKSGGLCMLHSL